MRKVLQYIAKFFTALFEIVSCLNVGKNPICATSQYYANNDSHNLIIHSLR